MPADKEAVAAVAEAFTQLLNFCHGVAVTGKSSYMAKVKGTLASKGSSTISGYKKALLQTLVEEFALRCGVMITDTEKKDVHDNPNGDVTEEWRKQWSLPV